MNAPAPDPTQVRAAIHQALTTAHVYLGVWQDPELIEEHVKRTLADCQAFRHQINALPADEANRPMLAYIDKVEDLAKRVMDLPSRGPDGGPCEELRMGVVVTVTPTPEGQARAGGGGA